MGRTDYYILNDPELCFQEVLRKKVSTENAQESKGAIKLESHEDILKFDKNEILVKLEKGEGTLKIEKVALKKEGASSADEKDKKKPEKPEEKAALTVVKSEKEEETPVKTEEPAPAATVEVPTSEEAELKSDEAEKTEEPETKEEPTESNTEVKEEAETKVKAEEVVVEKEKEKEKEKPKPTVDETADLCSKQAAELKAMFPDLEVIQPLSRLSQIDTFVLREQKSGGALDFSETTVAQLFNNAVKWPKEYAIQVRLQHIIYAIETKEWPASKSFSAYANGIGNEFDIPIHELPNEPPRREAGTPMSLGDSELITITTDSMGRANSMKKRRRHIAIDVETERAKLQALLNNTPVLSNPLMKHGMSWDNDDSEDSRRSTPVTAAALQPPPAHQQASRLLNMPYDLKYHASPKTIGQTTVIPGTSSTLTPIDLSSG